MATTLTSMQEPVTAGASFTARHPSGHLIVRHQDDWCVMSADGEHTLKRAKTREEAVLWADERFKAGAARGLVLRGAVGQIRTGEYRGKTHVVAPVVALIGDTAIWPVNAPSPELVTLEALAVAPAGWNGRPVCHGHPEDGGTQVSANSPEVLEASAMGQLFNCQLVDELLSLEAWIDRDLAAAVGGEETLRRLEANDPTDPVEVSVGCFVVSEEREGYDARGKRYAAVWLEIVPDHLALLPKGQTGACSVAAGCGIRAARVHLVTKDGLDEVPAAEGSMAKTETKVPRATGRSLRERIEGVLGRAAAATPAKDLTADVEVDIDRLTGLYGGMAGYMSRLTFQEEMSDADLRGKLYDALRAVQPGFLWIEEVYPESGKVVYCADPEGQTVTLRRSYGVAGEGDVTVSEDVEEVRRVTTYEVVAAQGAAADVAAAAAPCGCGGKGAAPTAAAKGEGTMAEHKNATRIKALVDAAHTPWAAADQKYLESVTDERLAEIERHAEEAKPAEPKAAEPKAEPKAEEAKAAPAAAAEPVTASAKPLTEDEWMKTAPPSVRALVDRAKQEDQARRDECIASLMSAQQAYSESDLKKMATEDLEKLVKALGEVSPESVADYTGRGFPRAASADGGESDIYRNPPDAWAKPGSQGKE